MPEKPRGPSSAKRSGNQERLPDYRKASRFPDEPASNIAYEAARDIIYEAPYDLSLYRTALLPTQDWYVLILGQTPNAEVRGRIDQALKTGEAVELPEDVWRLFNQRRLEQSGQGPWVERRYLPRRRTR